MAKKKSKWLFNLLIVLLVGGVLTYAFWPRPIIVDMQSVRRGVMNVTISEEGRTRVKDAYILSTPIAGRLMRVDAKPGDPVVRGESVVAHMMPTNPSVLDVRTREQARAAVEASEAGLRVARANLNRAIADRELALANLQRVRKLVTSKISTRAVLDQSTREARSADAAVDSAQAAIAMREAEVKNARAQLISFVDHGLSRALESGRNGTIPIVSPATGRVLRVIQQSETTLPAGAAIMEIGNVEADLEILVDLLSNDAVKVSPGDKVTITDWGGSDSLSGVVERVEPWGFTKVSALGVEEQRVNAVIAFDGSAENRKRLGHGFRVEVGVIVWQQADTLIAPASALFRQDENWAVFVVADGRAQLRHVEVGRNNGLQAQILQGVDEGESLIVYPASGIVDGSRIAQRQSG